MSVSISASDKDKSESTTKTSKATDKQEEPKKNTPVPSTPPKADTGLIGSDFKAAMDSYEEFMDEHIPFMEKYNANSSSLGLLADYIKYMSKYSEFVEDFEKWDDEALNDAESAYYIEVHMRVNKKLLEAAN